MTKPAYRTTARVTGGRAGGQGTITSGELEVKLQLPKELGGRRDESGAAVCDRLRGLL